MKLYPGYFQKSRIFLYPALGFSRGEDYGDRKKIIPGSPVVPSETYLAWKDKGISFKDKSLVCLYLKTDEYLAWREKHNKSPIDPARVDKFLKDLKKHKQLVSYHQVSDVISEKIVCVFDLSPYNKDIEMFVKGKYSKLSPQLKDKVRGYFTHSPNLTRIDSFMNPNKYFELYGELLGINPAVLKGVGELCDAPNLEKETLNMSINKGIWV